MKTQHVGSLSLAYSGSTKEMMQGGKRLL